MGLAVAARLAERFPELVILERRERHGSETSSRNSEVIHGGMYYPAGSLKARLCVRGKHLLYELVRAGGRRRTAARQADRRDAGGRGAGARAAARAGAANGVELELVGAEACRRLEPAVPAVAALVSPTTGIVSAHGLMDALLHEARRHGAILQPRAELVGIERRDARLSAGDPHARTGRRRSRASGS